MQNIPNTLFNVSCSKIYNFFPYCKRNFKKDKCMYFFKDFKHKTIKMSVNIKLQTIFPNIYEQRLIHGTVFKIKRKSDQKLKFLKPC